MTEKEKVTVTKELEYQVVGFDPRRAYPAVFDTFSSGQFERYDGSNAVRFRCEEPVTVTLSGGLMVDTQLPLMVACGSCRNCQKQKLEDLEGRFGAQMLISADIWMFTGTFDDWHSPEAMASSYVRDVFAVQLFQKRLRNQESYALKKHNKAELDKRDADPSYEPDLVDASRSYFKFYWVYEYGGNKGRGHWHALIFLESHFEVPPEVLAGGSIEACQKHVRRVWSPETHRGGGNATFEERKDPDVLTFRRYRKHKNYQTYKPWEWGWCEVQSAMFHASQGDGNERKSVDDLVKSLRYLTPYLKKGLTGRDTWEKHGESGQKGAGAERTMSRGIGSEFAKARAIQDASLSGSVLERNLTFVLQDFTFKRSAKSELERIARVQGGAVKFGSAGQIKEASYSVRSHLSGGLDGRALAHVDRRKRFRMHGAMGDAYCRHFVQKRTEMYGWPKVKEQIMRSEPLLRWTFRAVRNKYNAKLKTSDYEAKREAVAVRNRKEGRNDLLPDRLTPVPPYRICSDGLPADGTYRDGRRVSYEKVPIAERLLASWAEIERYERLYASVRSSDVLDTYGEVRVVNRESAYWSGSLEALLTERQRKSGAYVVQSEPSKLAQEAVRHGLKRLSEVMDQQESYERLCHVHRAMELVQESVERERVQNEMVPRYDVRAGDCLVEQTRNWLNHSDDFGWPDLRDQLVEQFFTVLSEGDGWRAVRSPKGATFMQRRAPARKGVKRLIELDGRHVKRVRNTVWATRRAESESEIEAAKAGDLTLASPEQRDALLFGDEPLRPKSSKTSRSGAGAIPVELRQDFSEIAIAAQQS